MARHPYFALSRRQLALATLVAFAAWAVLTVILVWAVPADHRAAIGALLSTPTGPEADALLAGWDVGVVRSFGFLLGFDFLYDLVHNNAAALLVVWGAVRHTGRGAQRLACATAWLMWLDTLLNLFEQVAFFQILRTGSSGALLPLASAVFSFRSLTLAFAVLVGAALHLAAGRGQR